MKNKILKGITVCIITVLAIACNPKKEDPTTAADVVDKEQIKADFQIMETAFDDAMNAGKPETIVYYSNDATSYSQNKPPLIGKAAIDKSLLEENTSKVKGDKVSYTVNEVHPSSDGEMVVEIGSYNVTDSNNTIKHSGNYMSLFHKVDGKYLCVRDMSASIMPLPKK